MKAALAGGRAKTTAEEGDIQEDMSPEELSNAAMLAASALYPAPDAAVCALKCPVSSAQTLRRIMLIWTRIVIMTTPSFLKLRLSQTHFYMGIWGEAGLHLSWYAV